MKQLIKLMIRGATIWGCASVFGYTNPIEGGTTQVVSNDWNVAVPWLYVGSNSSSNMLFVSNGGQVNNQIGIIGNNASAMENVAFISGSNAVWNSSQELSVGNLGSDNSLGIYGGGQVNTANAYIGKASSNNFVGITGAGSELSTTTLHVGHTGADNSVGIFDGGMISSDDASIGHWIGSDENSVVVMGTNSLWNNTGTLNVGEHGSENSLSILANGTVQSSVLNLGVYSYSSNNTLSVSGNNALLDAPELNIGGTATTAGGTGNRVSVSDGGTVATTNLTIHTGNNLDLNDGGTFAINNDFDASLEGFSFNSGGTLEVGGELTGMEAAIEDGRSVVIDGVDAIWDVGQPLFVGENSSGSLVKISDGATLISANASIGKSGVLNIEGPATSPDGNTVVVQGSGSVWSNQNGIVVGTFGNNNAVRILDGGKVYSESGTIGALPVPGVGVGSENQVLVAGIDSEWNLSGNLVVGESGAGNSLVVTNGGRVVNQIGMVGRKEGGDENYVLVSGNGSVWKNEQALYLGSTESQLSNTSFSNFGESGRNNSLTVEDGGVVLVGDVDTNNLPDLGTVGGIVVGDTTGAAEMVVANESSVTVPNAYIGLGEGESGSVRIMDSNTVWDAERIFVGYHGSGNRLEILDGALVDAGNELEIGKFQSSSNNLVTVAGADTGLDVAFLTVGLSGSDNTLIITNGATVSSVVVEVGGRRTGNEAVITGVDTRLSCNGLFIGGYAASDNSMHILDGAKVSSTFAGITVSPNSAVGPLGSNNLVRVSGAGSLWSIKGGLDLAAGELLVEDGGELFTGDANVMGDVLVEDSGSMWTNSSHLDVQIGSVTARGGGQINSDTVSIRGGGSVASTGEDSVFNVEDVLTIGDDSAGGNTILIEAGGRVANTIGYIGYNSSSDSNTVMVSGSGSVWQNHEALYMGTGGTGNSLSVEDGGLVLVGDVNTNNFSSIGSGGGILIGDASGTPEMIVANGAQVESSQGYIGLGADESGSVVVSGEGSIWNNTVYGTPSYTYSNPVNSGSLYDDPVVVPLGDLSVGYAGSGNSLVIENGGRVESLGSNIGYGEMATNNSVMVSGEGSVWENRGQLNVGYDGSGNLLRVEDGGAVVSVSGISIGYGEGADDNQVVVSGEGSSLRSGLYADGTLPPGTVVLPPYTTFAGGGSVISGSGYLMVGNTGSGNALTVSDGSFAGGNSYIGGATSNNSVSVFNGGSIWSNTTGLVITGGTFTGGEGGVVSNVVITPPVIQPNPVLIMNRLGELSVGRGGSGNSLLIEDGAQVYSMGGVIGQQSNAWNNAVSVIGTNSAWHSQYDLSVGGQMADYIAGWNTLESQIESAWFDGGRGNALHVADGGLVSVGRDLHNRNWSSINIDPGAAIHVASNYYQDATSSLRFGVETNAAGAPLNALVTVGGTVEFEKGAKIEYASNIGQLQFETVYTNKIIAADKLIVAGIENPDSLDLEMLDASGSLVDVIFWENDQDIYGLVGRNYLADTAGFDTNSMMGALANEIDDMSLLGDPNANSMINLLNTMSGSQQSAQLEQQYRQGAPAYQHGRSMTEGMNEIKKHATLKDKTKPAELTGAKGPYNPEQELQGWIKPYGLWADNAAQGGFSGYDQQVFGTVVGFDLPLEGALIGVASGYGYSSLDLDDGDQSTAKTGYAVFYLCSGTEDWFYDVNMGFGLSKIEQESGTAFANSADYDASNFALQIGGGKEIAINRRWAFTPKASALWSYYYQKDYTETSSQGVARNVDAYVRNDLLSTLGAAVSWQKQFKTMAIKPEARLYWLHQFNDDEGQIDYELVNGMGGQYYFLMAPPEADVLEAGLGLTCILNDDLQFVIDVDGRFGEDYSAYALSGRAVIEF
ncbi:autotransporter domain-containing protein [Pontiellaceae bacterium B1224]|nr:autotransporter domain-containing protein [Pontiellaceae bacterium B1224]